MKYHINQKYRILFCFTLIAILLQSSGSTPVSAQNQLVTLPVGVKAGDNITFKVLHSMNGTTVDLYDYFYSTTSNPAPLYSNDTFTILVNSIVNASSHGCYSTDNNTCEKFYPYLDVTVTTGSESTTGTVIDIGPFVADFIITTNWNFIMSHYNRSVSGNTWDWFNTTATYRVVDQLAFVQSSSIGKFNTSTFSPSTLETMGDITNSRQVSIYDLTTGTMDYLNRTISHDYLNGTSIIYDDYELVNTAYNGTHDVLDTILHPPVIVPSSQSSTTLSSTSETSISSQSTDSSGGVSTNPSPLPVNFAWACLMPLMVWVFVRKRSDTGKK